ncbi:DUF2460 domain-containing protein [Acinetobacter soli]|uniref:DUF2460 domain-containing protein n=1 Tax=Acinetobacter soli TaxID=487316 RepID=UPI0031BA4AFA
MSDVLFPELPGLEWDLTKTPMFNTKIMQSVNGRELRASYQAVPKYQISMSFAFLRESKGRKELQQLEGFFLERRGSFDSFLFKMPDDNQFECVFTGDGITTNFQLYKNFHTLETPVSHTKAEVTKNADPYFWNNDGSKPFWGAVYSPNIWSDEDDLVWSINQESAMWYESETYLMWSDYKYTISSNGLLILNRPLNEGEMMSVSGTYYYRCRFADDEQQYTNFMSKLWKAGKVEMIGSLGNKV